MGVWNGEVHVRDLGPVWKPEEIKETEIMKTSSVTLCSWLWDLSEKEVRIYRNWRHQKYKNKQI